MSEQWLAGQGEMRALIRSVDWSKSKLGPVSSWPQSLRTAASICLGSSFPMHIEWGPDLLMLYNDCFRPILGTKHPRALGEPMLEVFVEVRDALEPMFRGVLRSGQADGADDMLFLLERSGYTEETYFLFSSGPIRDESGGVGGLLTTCTETTQRVIGQRRLHTLHLLADRAAHATTAEDALREAAAAFDPRDVPFSLLYLVDADGQKARLAASSGLSPRVQAGLSEVDLREGSNAAWPFARVGPAATFERVTDVERVLGERPTSPWPVRPSEALVARIERPGYAHPLGFLVAGVSPCRALDAGYQQYFALVADQLASALANARAREQERRRADALAELDRAKTRFFSNVSHEFRTPLTLMLGPLEDLLRGARGPISELMRADLDAMHRNALRLLKLVNTLLEFSRIEAGRAQAAYEPVDLAALTADLAGMFRSAVERARLRLVVDCPPLPGPVYVDREMWEKIVLNLLSNAFKFTFEGAITVALRWRGEAVELEVRDTGSGIEAHELPHLFERFHRVHGARARTHEGTGIGLALVQDLLRLHGGDISVDTQPGRGSSFKAKVRTGTAHLPPERIGGARTLASTQIYANAFVEEALRWLPEAEPGALAPPLPEHTAQRHVSPSVLATAGARVLVADDNADMREYLCRILRQHWKVEAVADGLAALVSARADPPDVVLADVMMPVMDGFALLRELRADARTRSLQVVMLSARAGEEARIEGIDAGADDYLIKPFSARELVARVASQISLAVARRAIEHERETLYALFMQAPTPICILRGERHLIELANPMCCAVWGRAWEDVIGRPLFEALPELEGQGYQSLLARVLQTGELHVGKEAPAEFWVEGVRKRRYFNFVYAALRDVRAAIDGVLIIAFDVSDEIRARDELARTLQCNEMFAGVLAHDLRNPLCSILAAAQLLGRSRDAKTVKLARDIVVSGERMARMVEQLLDFTHARLGGGLTLHREQHDLAELVRRVVAEVGAAAPHWTVRVEQRGDSVGHWDGDRLAQVISNLAGNAVQHGLPDAPLRIQIDGRDPRAVVLSFHNRGEIPRQLLSSIFDPFRGAERRRDGSSGLGLGLYITKEIVERHGGTIRVSSSVDLGTEFTLLLPRPDAKGTNGAALSPADGNERRARSLPRSP